MTLKSAFRFCLSAALSLASLSAQPDYTFSDGGRPVYYRASANEVFGHRGSGAAGVRTSAGQKEWGGGTLLKLGANEPARAKVKSGWPGRSVSLAPVFYNLGDLPAAEVLAALPAAEREKRLDAARRLMTPKLLVKTAAAAGGSRYAGLAPTHPVSQEASFLEGWVLVTYANAFAALDAADWMVGQGGWEFTPVFAREFSLRGLLKRPVNDPLYPMQWHLDDGAPFNLGMKTAWDRVTGKGINIAVVDDAFEIKHEDLANNAYPLESGFHRNFKEDGEPNDPSPMNAAENHGTYCGGLAVAAGFNSVGLTGVAPEARAMGLRLIGGATAEDASARALAWQPEGVITHVSSNSWGPDDDGKSDGRVGALTLSGLERGATRNRDGLGTVYAISCGNGRGKDDDSSYDGFSSSRFAIAVAAAGNDGKQSSYSETGMAVAITALGGEFQPPNVMWSTNVSGSEAYQAKNESFPGSKAPMNYTDAANGTSSAAPQVAGAAALLLEANRNLSYRDVKEILMLSASRAGLRGGDEFKTNAGGFTFSHSFGAGLLNVSAAVELAANWRPLRALSSVESMENGGKIDDDGTPTTVTLADFAAAKLRVEHVELTVNVEHKRRGDLGFIIRSPSGFLAAAEARPNDDNANFVEYQFTTPRFWGESSAGAWKVLVVDTEENGVSGTLRNVKLKLYGTAQ